MTRKKKIQMLGYRTIEVPAIPTTHAAIISVHENVQKNRWFSICSCMEGTVSISLTRDDAITQSRIHQQSRHADQAVIYQIA